MTYDYIPYKLQKRFNQ